MSVSMLIPIFFHIVISVACIHKVRTNKIQYFMFFKLITCGVTRRVESTPSDFLHDMGIDMTASTI